MAEKTTKKATKVAAEKEVKAPAKKACAKKTCATKATAEKKAPAKKAAAKSSVIYVNAENAGFRAGDIYQALAAAQGALTVAEIAKQANVAAEDVYLGLGWLLKEGKIAATEDNKIVLA